MFKLILKYLVKLFILCTISLSVSSKEDYVWNSFESNLIEPKIFPKNGKIELSEARYKDGLHSLLWDFESKGQLIFNYPFSIDSKDAALPITFLLWIYNEKSINHPMKFEFVNSENKVKSFEMNLNFTGWRGVAVPFRDMRGDVFSSINKLLISAPEESGRVYLDQIMFNIPVDNRYPIPSYITPFVNPEVNTAVNKNWNALLMYDNMLSEHYKIINFNDSIDPNHPRAGLIFQRFDNYLGVTNTKNITNEDIKKNLEKYHKFDIKIVDGIIRGKRLDYPARQSFMKNSKVFDKQEQVFLLDSISMRELGKTMLETAKLLRCIDLDNELRLQLETQFLLATRYLFDQGLVRGSGIQIVTHLGYQTKEIFDSWFLTRELLEKNNLLKEAQGAIMWFSGTGRIFETDHDIVEANVDILNTQLQWMLKSILLIPDTKQRESLLTQYSSWLSKTILQSKGIAGGFKNDGSMFHHSQHYTAYGKDAFGGLSPVVYAISGTPYALTGEAHKRLNDVLYKMWIYTKERNIPIVLSGRHPTGLFKIDSAPFKWFALAGEINNPQQINKIFASIYAALENKPDFEGVSAAEEPIGAWAMNYASMAVQRRYDKSVLNKSWLVVVRGMSRYLVGNEAYEKNNRYSRYLQYGTLELLPADLEQRGFSHAGWDWNRFPGTTSIYLPLPELKSKLLQLPAAGLEEMLLSTETYSGATDLNNNSMFAIKLHGHAKYQQESFKAKKSYFLFENQIIALGSDIENDDHQHRTETTLFQHAVPKKQPMFIDAQKVEQLGSEYNIATPTILTDPAGNTYFLPKDQSIRVTYSNQNSLDDRDDKPTVGAFATAVIDHGISPKQGSYEYAMLIAPMKEEKPQYNVLSRNGRLHAVKNKKGNQEGYAYFEPYSQDVGGFITAADKPLMALVEPKNNSLDLSIVNPDLAFYNGIEQDQVDSSGKQVEVSVYSRKWRANASQLQTSTITLKNKWELQGKSQCAAIRQQGKYTKVKIITIDATPCKFTLNSI